MAMELYYENGERRLYILQVVQTNDLGEYRLLLAAAWAVLCCSHTG
jgi:hypothetical protein